MTEQRDGECDDVLVAVMAGLDGETPALPADAIEAHLGRCVDCRAAVAPMKALHARLTEVQYTGPRVDLWPAVSQRLGRRPDAAREWIAFAAVAVIAVSWRTGQLLFDLPLPVLNAVVPFTALMLITGWLVGDPLAIKMNPPELRQERA